MNRRSFLLSLGVLAETLHAVSASALEHSIRRLMKLGEAGQEQDPLNLARVAHRVRVRVSVSRYLTRNPRQQAIKQSIA